MEEILMLIFQFIIEVLIQGLLEVPWDRFIGSRSPADSKDSEATGWIALSIIVGGGVGAASLLAFPTTLLHWAPARIANLAVAPAVSVFASRWFSRSKERQPPDPYHGRLRAACAACFTFSLAAVRFTFASRPHL